MGNGGREGGRGRSGGWMCINAIEERNGVLGCLFACLWWWWRYLTSLLSFLYCVQISHALICRCVLGIGHWLCREKGCDNSKGVWQYAGVYKNNRQSEAESESYHWCILLYIGGVKWQTALWGAPETLVPGLWICWQWENNFSLERLEGINLMIYEMEEIGLHSVIASMTDDRW